MPAMPDPATMPEYQLTRRASILRAAREMIEERDLDLVQMKDVAKRAGVAVGTLYRYFNSKDHLYAVVLGEWGRPRPEEWYAKLQPSDRFRVRAHQMFSALAKHPQYYSLVRMLSSTDDPAAIAEATEMGNELTAVLVEELEGLPEDEAYNIAQIVWALQADLLSQVSQGRIDLKECLRIVDTFADLVGLRMAAITV